MTSSAIEQILNQRQERARQNNYEWVMTLNDEQFSLIDNRHQFYCPGEMTKEGMAHDYAHSLAVAMREVEKAAIVRGLKKLTIDGRLISVPTKAEIDEINKMLGQLGV